MRPRRRAGSRRGPPARGRRRAPPSYLLHGPAPEEPLGPEQEDQDEDGEGDGVAERRDGVAGDVLLGEAEDELGF